MSRSHYTGNKGQSNFHHFCFLSASEIKITMTAFAALSLNRKWDYLKDVLLFFWCTKIIKRLRLLHKTHHFGGAFATRSQKVTSPSRGDTQSIQQVFLAGKAGTLTNCISLVANR